MKKYFVWMTVLLLLWLVMTCVFLILAPDQVPVHFDIHGNVDRMGSKYELLIFPGIGFGLVALWLFGDKLGIKKATAGNEKTVAITIICLLIFMLLLFGYFMWKALDPAAAKEGLVHLAQRGTILLMMVLFIVLGNQMPKVRRNSVMGLRTTWSMYNDTCWQKSQRLGGYTMMTCGVVGLVLCAALPGAWAIGVVLGLIAVMLVVTIAGSYLIYKKVKESEE